MAVRDYKREYKIRSQKSKDDRQHRRIARRLMAKKLGIKKIKGKDVDHKNGNPRDNRKSNLRIRSKSVNRKRNYS